MIKVKVCGMTEITQIRELADLGVNYAGLIFYRPSPRFCVEKIQISELKSVSNEIKLTGVFVDDSIEDIKKKIHRYSLSAVQLCGRESPAQCMELRQFAKVWKVIHIGKGGTKSGVMDEYRDAADYLLFDTQTRKYGGSGNKFSWDYLKTIDIKNPFFLSGGIAPEDAEKVSRFDHPFLFGVDINSRFETEPGIKDMGKVKEFINQLKLQ